MENVSISVIILFVAATVFTVWQFYSASGKSKVVLIVLGILLLMQTVLGLAGFYQQNMQFPPGLTFLLAPEILIIIILFITKGGRAFLDSLDLKKLTLLHVVRVPVEITLYFLFVAGLVPILMTFEGYNYDILSGISAPIIYYLSFVIKKVNKTALLIWNFVCLGLLVNIVTIAILAVETPFQKLAFDQPNVGVTLFPFVWLPGIIVPIVLLSHLASIRKLWDAGEFD